VDSADVKRRAYRGVARMRKCASGWGAALMRKGGCTEWRKHAKEEMRKSGKTQYRNYGITEKRKDAIAEERDCGNTDIR
jgi:hypothetical protein